ncbi:MAG: aldo/keto reductase [Rubellimicrobium sp.]|nr:aldo/keto reductase [Rubellimicrobium sp.]
MQLRTRHWDRHGKGGLTFTELGFGSAPMANLYRAVGEDEAQGAMAAAWAGGVRHFDTAPLYGLGLAETRLNRFLRDRARGDYVLSSKVGRLLRPCAPEARTGIGKFFDVPNRVEVYDYTHDGVLRSFEHSLERLGVDRIDVLYAHDLDVVNHGSWPAALGKLAEFMHGGYRALLRLRDEGVIAGFGAGINEWEVAAWLLERGDFDLFLLAGRYTLLEQEALHGFMEPAAARGVGVVIGGPYNSGILATGAREGAFYNYVPAPPAIMARVARIEAVCARHAVAMVDAAFQFPLRHRAVVSVIPGGSNAAEVAANLRAAQAVIPDDFWAEMKAEGLIAAEAPV